MENLDNLPVESHPFVPFLPEGARVLFLGSFPPSEKRWSMPFYYPNFQNDFWRVMGLIFFSDKDHFTLKGEKKFDMDSIIGFCTETGFALYDTATRIRRLRDNASDKFLEIVTPTDIEELLVKIPLCRCVVTTGQKATEEICAAYGCPLPGVGCGIPVKRGSREFILHRMPSTSRAYPLSLEKKAAFYRKMLEETGIV